MRGGGGGQKGVGLWPANSGQLCPEGPGKGREVQGLAVWKGRQPGWESLCFWAVVVYRAICVSNL